MLLAVLATVTANNPTATVVASQPDSGNAMRRTRVPADHVLAGRSSGSRASPACAPVSSSGATVATAAQRRTPCSIHIDAPMGPLPDSGSAWLAATSHSRSIGVPASGAETSSTKTAPVCLDDAVSRDGMPQSSIARGR
ncbi:hypothetical protein [Cupriavidus pauculus]|uniref:hypothetical protein n=1 Tax=Cupriavidus pauculus TaxID=82633 RepID=UPI001EE2BB45|nr:hypothetical protein [Cupriavidus pauculus]